MKNNYYNKVIIKIYYKIQKISHKNMDMLKM